MILTKDNVIQYAWNNYANPQAYHGDEFFEDMKIFSFIKKLLTRYRKGDDVNHHLTLNHIITVINLFGAHASRDLLHYYIPEASHQSLNSFLLYLSIIPEPKEDVNYDAGILEFLETL